MYCGWLNNLSFSLKQIDLNKDWRTLDQDVLMASQCPLPLWNMYPCSFRAIWSPLFHHWTRQSWMVSSELKRVLLVLFVLALVLLVLVLVLLVLVLLILVLVLVLIVIVLALLVLGWGEGWDRFITVLHHLSTGEHLLDTAVPQKCTKGPTNWSSLCFALFLLVFWKQQQIE